MDQEHLEKTARLWAEIRDMLIKCGVEQVNEGFLSNFDGLPFHQIGHFLRGWLIEDEEMREYAQCLNSDPFNGFGVWFRDHTGPDIFVLMRPDGRIGISARLHSLGPPSELCIVLLMQEDYELVQFLENLR